MGIGREGPGPFGGPLGGSREVRGQGCRPPGWPRERGLEGFGTLSGSPRPSVAAGRGNGVPAGSAGRLAG
ncbi:MAG TPA: hypothetical protein VHS79_19635, partial [Actinomycetes bacterium]|nr:hypothetical protein [Actinomycetes bacterium]